MDRISCKIGRSFKDVEGLQETWDRLVADLGCSVYLSYNWSRLWWEYYGLENGLRLYTFEYGGRLVGVVPIYIHHLKLGPLRFKCAKLVGSSNPPRVFDLPIRKELASDIFDILLTDLISRENCDCMSFGLLSRTSALLPELQKVCKKRHDLVGSFSAEKVGVHSVFHLPESVEEYYRSLSKNERKHRRKYDLRYLRKSYDTKLEVVADKEEVEKEFKDFITMHTTQWNKKGRPGHFGAWPRGKEFNEALVKEFSQYRKVKLLKLTANEEVIAYQYFFVFGNRYFWILPAQSADPKWSRFSLGRTSLVNLIKLAIEERIDNIEGGPGHYDYKKRLGAKEYPTITFRVTANRLRSKLGMKVFMSAFRVVDIFYFKIWYRRVQPRLPSCFHKPIWPKWIRLSI